jgi:hypothetical protein
VWQHLFPHSGCPGAHHETLHVVGNSLVPPVGGRV